MGFINKHLRRHDFVTGKPSRFIVCGTAGEYTTGGVIGFKSETFMEAGFIFAPYVPIYESEEFQPRQGISSRYATATVNNRYYSTITFDGVQMPTVNRTFS